MKKIVLLTAAVLAASPALADTGTVIHGGEILSNVVAWLAAAFGTAIATLLVAVVYRVLAKLGIQVTEQQKAVLQGVVVNGVNDAALKARAALGSNAKMDINVQQQVVADAVTYVQSHAADTIKSLGLDPNSGQAVEAIRARIATAIADPAVPTDPAVTPAASEDAPSDEPAPMDMNGNVLR